MNLQIAWKSAWNVVEFAFLHEANYDLNLQKLEFLFSSKKRLRFIELILFALLFFILYNLLEIKSAKKKQRNYEQVRNYSYAAHFN